ncbi:MAG: VanW family protein [Candidatus Colwellbacteria bacterium]
MEQQSSRKLGLLAYRLTLTGLIILAAFNFGSIFYIYAVVHLPAKADVRSFTPALESATNKDLSLKVGDQMVVIKSGELKEWLEHYQRSYSGKEDIRVSAEKLDDYLRSLATMTNVEPVNANIRFENDKATTFRAPVEGSRLDIGGSANIIIAALKNGEGSVELPVVKIPPTVTLEKINNLGIKTLISKGESNFVGSSPARTNNIRIGASKYNGFIVPPGQEFSFNKVLGEVDETGGYQAELVIKSGLLIPEYGGGLCQVSTTLFRAAINAGLPIVERRPHSFPVKYYNPQGFDATIYPGVVDLRFVNNTPAHILIQSKISGTKLLFEIYGSDDGRVVTMDGPHQYDQKTNGSMKAYFVRKITSADGTEKEERFQSNYNAPAPLARNPLE